MHVMYTLSDICLIGKYTTSPYFDSYIISTTAFQGYEKEIFTLVLRVQNKTENWYVT